MVQLNLKVGKAALLEMAVFVLSILQICQNVTYFVNLLFHVSSFSVKEQSHFSE